MKIQVDQEGKKIMEGLCDAAMKFNDIQNRQAIQNILNAVELIVEDEVETTPEPAPKAAVITPEVV